MGVTKLSHNLLQQLKKINLKKQKKELHTTLRSSASSFLDVEIVKLLREKYDNIKKILVNNPKIKINRAKNYINIDGTLFFINDKYIQENIPWYNENVRNVDNMQFYNIAWLHEHVGDNLPTIKELENAGKMVGGMNNLFSVLWAEETGFMVDAKTHERALPDTNILPVKTPQTGEFGICKWQRGEKTHIVPIHEKNFVGAAFKNTLADTEHEELITENMIKGLLVINRDINILFDTVDTKQKIDDTLYTIYTSSKQNKTPEEIYAKNSICVAGRIQDHFEGMIRGLLEKFPASKPNFERIKKLLFEHMEIIGYRKEDIEYERNNYFINNAPRWSDANNFLSVYQLLRPYKNREERYISFIGSQELQRDKPITGETTNTIEKIIDGYGKRSYYDKNGKKILTQYEYGNYPIALYSKARHKKLQKRAQIITDIKQNNPEKLQRLAPENSLLKDKASEITLINWYTAQITHSNDSFQELPNIMKTIQLPKNRQEVLDIIGEKIQALQNKTIMTQEGMYPIIEIPWTNTYTLAMKTCENAYNGTILIDIASYQDPFYQWYRDELAKNLHADKQERFGWYKAKSNLKKATKDSTYVKAKVLRRNTQDVGRNNEIVFTWMQKNIDQQTEIQEQRQALLRYTWRLSRDTIVWMVKNIPLENLAQAPLFSQIIQNRDQYERFLCGIATRRTSTEQENSDKHKILQGYMEAETTYQLSYAIAGWILAHSDTTIVPTIISHMSKFTERSSATDICYFSEVLGKHYNHKNNMIQSLIDAGGMDTVLLMLHTKSIDNISQEFLWPILEYIKKIGDDTYTKLLRWYTWYKGTSIEKVHECMNNIVGPQKEQEIKFIYPKEKPIERELWEKKTSRTTEELKKMDGQDVVVVTDKWETCEWKIVIDDHIYVVHNNWSADGAKPSPWKMNWYSFWWALFEKNNSSNIYYKSIQLRKKKENNQERILWPKRKSRTKKELKNMEGQDAIITTSRWNICEWKIVVDHDNIYIVHNNSKSDNNISLSETYGYKYVWILYIATEDDKTQHNENFSYIQLRKKKENTPKQITSSKEIIPQKENISFIKISQEVHPGFHKETPEKISWIEDRLPLFKWPLTLTSAEKLKEYGYTDLVALHKNTEKLPAEFFTDTIAKEVIAKHGVEVFVDHIQKFNDLSDEVANDIFTMKEIEKYWILVNHIDKFKDLPAHMISSEEAEKCLSKYGLEEYSKYAHCFADFAKKWLKKAYDSFFAKNKRDEIVKYNLLFIDFIPTRFARRLERHGYTLLSPDTKKPYFAAHETNTMLWAIKTNDIPLPDQEMYINVTNILKKKNKETSKEDEYVDTRTTRTAGELRKKDGKKVILVTNTWITCEGEIAVDPRGNVYVMHNNPDADGGHSISKRYKYGRIIYNHYMEYWGQNNQYYISMTFQETFIKQNKDTTIIEDIVEEYDQFCMPRDFFYHNESKWLDIADRKAYIVRRTREDGHSYGFDTLYIVDLTEKARVYIKKIADTRSDKKYIQIGDVEVKGDDIIIKTSVGTFTEKYKPLIERNKLVQDALHDHTDTHNEKIKALKLTESEYTQAIQTIRTEAREALYPEHAQLDRVLALVNKDVKYGDGFAKMISADKKRCKTNQNIARVMLDTLTNNFREKTELLDQMHSILIKDIDLERKVESQAKLPEFDEIYSGNRAKYHELMAKIIDFSGDDFIKLIEKYSDKKTLLRICIDQNKKPRWFFRALGEYDYEDGIKEVIRKNPEGIFQDLLQDMIRTSTIGKYVEGDIRCFRNYKNILESINNNEIKTSLYLQLLYTNVTSMKEYLEQDMAQNLLWVKKPHCSKIFRHLNDIGKFDAKKVELDGMKLFYALKLDLLDKDYLDDFALFLATQNLSDEIVSQYTEEFVDCIRGPYTQETGNSMDDVIHGRYEECHEARLKALRRLLTLSTQAYKHFISYTQKQWYDVTDFKETVYTAPGI